MCQICHFRQSHPIAKPSNLASLERDHGHVVPKPQISGFQAVVGITVSPGACESLTGRIVARRR